jgi:hypothetical protein
VDELVARGFLDNVEFVKVGKYTRACFVKAGSSLPSAQMEAAPQAGAHAYEPPAPVDEAEQLKARYGITNEHYALWDQVLAGLKPQLSPATFISFVEPTVLLSIVEGAATVGARNPFAQSWLQSRRVKRFKEELNYYLRAAQQPLVSEVTVVPLADEGQSSG